MAGGAASGGQRRALLEELGRIWDVPQGNKDLFLRVTGCCLPIKGQERLHSQLVF